MIAKFVIVLAIFLIVLSLGRALYYLVKSRDAGMRVRTAKALTVRIGLSILLFVMLLIAFATGMIQPHGLSPMRDSGSANIAPPSERVMQQENQKE